LEGLLERLCRGGQRLQYEESPPEERGKHPNFYRIGCWDVLPFSRSPLEHNVIREKVILN
jgi:hypothetical protein